MTMDPETLAALRGSIQKWRDIVAGTGSDLGTENCPLCLLFHDNEVEDDEGDMRNCDGCPVSEHSGNDECSGTPFSTWIKLTVDQGSERRALTPKHTRAAQAELDFLISLLPVGEAP